MASSSRLNQMYLRSMMDLTVESFRYLVGKMRNMYMYREDTKEVISFVVMYETDYESAEDELGQWTAGCMADGIHFTGKGHCQRCAENDCAK